MHSSRMRTIRCSGRLGWRFACRGVCLGEGSVCPKVGPAQGGVCLGVYTPWTQRQTHPRLRGRHTPAPVDRIIDTSLWKHYLSGTTVSDSKNIDLDKMTLKKYWFPTSKETIHIISFQPISKKRAPQSIHWLSVVSLWMNVIGTFWRATTSELIHIVWLALHTVTGSPSSLHWDVAKTVHNTKIGWFLNYNLKVVVVLLCLICCLWLV